MGHPTMNPSPEMSYLLPLSATDVDLNHLRQYHPIPEKNPHTKN